MKYRKVKASGPDGRLPEKDDQYYTETIEGKSGSLLRKDNHWYVDENQDGKLLFGIKDDFIEYWLEETQEKEWVSVEDRLPNCWETGDWDGKRSDPMLCIDQKYGMQIAHCYSGIMDGSEFYEWYDKDDFGLKYDITHWRELPEPPRKE